MGIKNLNKFIKKHYPDLIHTHSLKSLRDSKIAIDTSIFMWKYKMHSNGSNWIQYFFNLVQLLRSHNIHITFCFDGKAPNEKSDTQKERIESREKSRQRLTNIEDAYSEYLISKNMSEELSAFCKRNDIMSESDKIDHDKLNEKISQMKNNLDIKICKEDFEYLKNFLDDMNVPHITANGEAEMLCSDLCKSQKVDYVLSSDSDILAYGCPSSIISINSQLQNVDVIYHNELLEKLNLTYDEFVDLCIMFGTDYNKNIFKVGPETSFNIIKKVRSIDNIENYDISILNHKTVRNLFKNHPTYDQPISYCGIPRFSEITSKYNIYTNTINKNSFIAKINFI